MPALNINKETDYKLQKCTSKGLFQQITDMSTLNKLKLTTGNVLVVCNINPNSFHVGLRT